MAKKRRYILYTAVSIITEYINKDIEIITFENKNIVSIVTENINTIYKDIKKNEEKPRTDYLFSGLQDDKQKNIAESIRKMAMMNNLVAKEIQTPSELLNNESIKE